MVNHESRPAGFEGELSQPELREIFHNLAETLVFKGEINSLADEFPETAGINNPNEFSFRLPTRFMQEEFYSEDDEIIPTPEDSAAYFISPHRFDADEDSVSSSVGVISFFRVAGTDISCFESTVISEEDGLLKGETDREYSRDGVVISPNGFTFEEIDMQSAPSFLAALDRLIADDEALKRPLMPEDVEKLNKVIEFIKRSL